MAKPRPAQAKKASDPMTLMNLTAGKWVSQAIAVAAELGIADLLKDGPRTAADIARTANASEDGVYRLLRARGSVGLFSETGNRRFRLTPLGRLLRTDSPQAFGGYARFTGHESEFRPWGELRHSVRTGEPESPVSGLGEKPNAPQGAEQPRDPVYRSVRRSRNVGGRPGPVLQDVCNAELGSDRNCLTHAFASSQVHQGHRIGSLLRSGRSRFHHILPRFKR
jgi:hypothetical protein